MKQPFFILPAILVLCLLVRPVTVHALDISITPDGSIEWYSDNVLGDDDDEAEDQDEDENEVEDENEDEDDDSSEQESETRRDASPQKVIAPAQKQEIRIRSNQDRLEVETIRRRGSGKQVLESEETDRLRLNLPARQTEEQRRLEMAKRRANNSESSVEELKRQVEEQEKLRELELSKLTPAERKQRQLFYEEQKQERQEREEERLELRNNIGPDGQELNLESRGIRAALRDKTVTIDPETNSLILTTKDGEERVLTTLPDQAVERMLEVRGVDDVDTENVEIRERDGKLEYVTQARRMKRLFGLFERPVETELSVDDESGELTETVRQRSTLIGRFLDSISF